jgi:metallo-beta-lactamase class B
MHSILRTLVLAATLGGAALAQNIDLKTWNDPIPPFKIVGPIHYVGTFDLGVYLITTPQGHILIDGGLAESAPVIERSIRTLGFKPEDIRILLTTQAHFDHVASLAHFVRVSRGRVEVMQGDDKLVADGGKSDYLFGTEARFLFEPVKVDRVLRDGDTVSLGNVRLTARLTPGHTPGSTTWMTTVEDGGRKYSVVFPNSGGINAGTRLVNRPSYPTIADDYRKTFAVLDTLRPDIFLGAHANLWRLHEKRANMAQAPGPAAFVDPDGYRTFVAGRRAAFEQQIANERAESR